MCSFRGPTRRSYTEASDCCQLPAACVRSFGVISTCTSFSASENVSGVTTGPTGAAVPKAGGAPGVVGVCFARAVLADIAAPINPKEPFARNSRRDRGIVLLFRFCLSEIECDTLRYITRFIRN